MTILNASKFLDTKNRMAVYRITDPNTSANMRELVKEGPVECVAWLHAEDTDPKTGELVEKVYVSTDKGNFATISHSFIRQFKEFVQGNGDLYELTKFCVIEKETKNGRKCILFSPLDVKEVGTDD